MGLLMKYVRAIDKLSEWLGAVSMYIVILTVVIGFSNVVLRYMGRFVGIRLTSNVLIELQWYLYSLIFVFGFAYILKHGINVRVDFWFAEQSRKTQAMIDFVGHWIALIPFCVLALVVAYSPILRSWGLLPNGSWGMWEMSPDPSGLPRAPIKTMIIFAFLTLLLQALAEVIKLWVTIKGEADLVKVPDAPLRIE